MNAFDFIIKPNNDPFYSSQLAYEYAQWTGNVKVPCTVPIVHIRGIVQTTIITSLQHLINAVHLLTMINEPFMNVDNEIKHQQELISKWKKENILENFFKEFVNMIENLSQNNNNTETHAVIALLTNMKQMFDLNLLEHYYNIIIPYVKECGKNKLFYSPEKHTIKSRPFAYQFYIQSELATEIREYYAKYCIPFDVIYIMTYCYVCGIDGDVLSNFVFDLVARACKGYFNVCPYEQYTNNITNNIYT